MTMPSGPLAYRTPPLVTESVTCLGRFVKEDEKRALELNLRPFKTSGDSLVTRLLAGILVWPPCSFIQGSL